MLKNQKLPFGNEMNEKIFVQSAISILLLTFNLLILNCTKKPDSEQTIVARVGEKTITVNDFKYNYEFGLPHLKQSPDRKRSYLEFIIKEQMLSLEGYRLGLDESERVQRLEDDLLEELLVEELFEKEVHEKIKISPEQIREAVTKSKVKWKLRYWVEPAPDYANSVCQAMRQRGYSAVVSDILNNNPEVKLELEDFETDYLTWLDVSTELLDAIKDLPIGEISDPVEINGLYFIFQMVDIRREPLTEYEIQHRAESYRQTLFYRKVKENAARFVSNFMTPKNVVTNGDAFRKLSSALFEWHKKQEQLPENFMQAVESAAEKESALFDLKNNLNRTLVSFENGKWTIQDFLSRFDVNSIKANFQDKNEYREALNQQIAVKVRNHFFVKEAEKRGLHKSLSVKKELQAWQDKWVYEEARQQYLQNLKITDDQARTYFDRYKDKYKIRWDDEPKFEDFINQAKRDAYIQNAQSILNQKIDSLKQIYPIVIYQAVLDTIVVIDFEKSRWASFQIFKRSSGRMARPIVDPAWGF